VLRPAEFYDKVAEYFRKTSSCEIDEVFRVDLSLVRKSGIFQLATGSFGLFIVYIVSVTHSHYHTHSQTEFNEMDESFLNLHTINLTFYFFFYD